MSEKQTRVEDAIPHRKPMLLVDEIIEQTPDQIRCRKTFLPDEFFLQGHFPNFPLVPGVILCECAMQTGAILLSSKSTQGGGGIPIATRMDGVKFKHMVRPGDTIEIIVTLNEIVSTAYFMTGKIMLDNKVVARLDFACSVANSDV